MKPVKLTSPTTGMEFEGIITGDGNVIFQNPIDGSMRELVYDAEHDTYTLNARLFEYVEVIEARYAHHVLEVSRARIDTIIKERVIPYFVVHDHKFFARKDLDHYAKHRKVGRPSKGEERWKRKS